MQTPRIEINEVGPGSQPALLIRDSGKGILMETVTANSKRSEGWNKTSGLRFVSRNSETSPPAEIDRGVSSAARLRPHLASASGVIGQEHGATLCGSLAGPSSPLSDCRATLTKGARCKQDSSYSRPRSTSRSRCATQVPQKKAVRGDKSTRFASTKVGHSEEIRSDKGT